MAIKKYKNYSELKTSTLQATADFIDTDTNALIEVGYDFPFENFNTALDDVIEFHAYSTDDRLLNSKKEATYTTVPSTDGSSAVTLNLDPATELRSMDFTLGKYKYVYNIYKKITDRNMYIHKISPSRTELILRPVKSRNKVLDYKNSIQFIHFANKLALGAEVGYEMFDIDGDGFVNIVDLVAMVNHMADDPILVPEEIREIELTPKDVQIVAQWIISTGGNDIQGKINFIPESLQNISLENVREMQGNPDLTLDDLQDMWIELANRMLKLKQQDMPVLVPEELNTYLNFGDNNFELLTNWMIDDKTYPEIPHAVVVKLYEPLTEEIQEHAQVGAVRFYSAPVVDKISLVGSAPTQYEVNQLAPHHKDVEVNIPKRQMESFETWNEILGNKPTTSQQLIDFYLSGSHIEQSVNIDYTDYQNFIKFGSAYERLTNFKYKLGLIETYDSSSDAYSTVSGSQGTVNYYKDLRDEVKRGFDGYEKFLYYESGSYISQSGLGSATKVDFEDATAPKINSVKPYNLYSTTSSQFINWYATQSSNAINHDNFNDDSLSKQLPTHIKMNSENVEFLLFMDMVGQHFDTIWTYAKNIPTVADRTHNIESNYIYNPNLFGSENAEGMHKDITYFVAQSMGLKLQNGQDLVKLWKYALGENQFQDGKITVSGNKVSIEGSSLGDELEDGTLFVPASQTGTTDFESVITDVYHLSASLSTSWTGADFTTSDFTISYDIDNSESNSLSANNYTKEIWRRLLNNLPYLAKTKGTARSVKALISCYGIPATILQIMEYGGPKPAGKSYYTNERFVYALHYTGSNQYFPIDWKNTSTGNRPETIQFRFAFDRDDNTGASIENRNSVRLATLGGGTTESANWDVRAYPLSGSTAHDVKSYQYGHSITGSFNAISASVKEWGYLEFNLSGSDGYKSITSSVYPIYDQNFWNVALQRTDVLSDGLFSDSTFDTPSKWTIVAASGSVGGGSGSFISASNNTRMDANPDIIAAIGKTYRVQYDIKTIVSGAVFPVVGRAEGVARDSVGTYVDYLSPTHNEYIYIRTSDAGDGSTFATIDNFQVTEVTSSKWTMMLKQAIGDEVSFSSVTDLEFELSGSASASYLNAWSGESTSNYGKKSNLYIPDSGSNLDGGWFSGSLQEFRLWNNVLPEAQIDIHAKAPLAYAGGTTSSLYDNLEMRLPFTEIYEHEIPGVANNTAHSSSTVSYLKTYQPTASLINFGTTNNSYKEWEIENNFELPNIGANRKTSNKIRIEKNYLQADSHLNTYIRSEVKSNDYAPVDSPKLDINFNPQQPINEDIIADFAGLEFDDFIGDPRDLYKSHYKDLQTIRNQYFQRFDKKNNFFDFIRLIQYYDSTLFDHIKSLVPYRAHESVGLVIEPHILERSKYERWKQPVTEELHFRNDIGYFDQGPKCTGSLSSSHQYLTSSVNMMTDKMEGFGLWNDSIDGNYASGSTIDVQNWMGNHIPVNFSESVKFDKTTVTDAMTVKFANKFLASGSKCTELSVDVAFKVKVTGSSVDGLQNALETTYLADIETPDSHKSSSYHYGFGGASNATNEDWLGNPEVEAYHPFVHKQRLNNVALIHSSSVYEYVKSDGTLCEVPVIPYGFWDNDRSITGSIDSDMASKGFLPTEYTPRVDTATQRQRYGGMKNTKDVAYDGKDPVEQFETAPTQLVVSTTSPNTLAVQ